MIHELIYTSKATPMLTDITLLCILKTSRVRNEDLSITGLLLYDGYRFMQTLEGTKESVHQVMDIIRASKLHKNIRMHSDREIGVRNFGQWSLQYKEVEISNFDDRLTNIIKGIESLR